MMSFQDAKVSVFAFNEENLLGYLPPIVLHRIRLWRSEGSVIHRNQPLTFIVYGPKLYGRRILYEEDTKGFVDHSNDPVDENKVNEIFLKDIEEYTKDNGKIWMFMREKDVASFKQTVKQKKVPGIHFYIRDEAAVLCTFDRPNLIPVLYKSITSFIPQNFKDLNN